MLVPAMVGCLQDRFQVLCQYFCIVVVEKDKEGNAVISLDDEPKMKRPNSHVELSYTYFMAWYDMHCPSLISTVQSSENSAICLATGSTRFEMVGTC